MKHELRLYQFEAVERIRQAIREGHKRIMLQAPTGAGKTAIAAHLVRSAYEKEKKAYFICDRIELIEQAVERFDAEDIPLGVCQADHDRTDRTHRIQVSSIQTMVRRECLSADLYIQDEAHTMFKAHIELMKENPDAIWLGLSATPWAKGLGKHFTKLIVVSTTQKLIDEGFLVPINVYGPSSPDLSKVKIVAGEYEEEGLAEATNRPKLVGDIVQTWLKLAGGRQTLAFAVNIAHSMAIVDEFQRCGVAAQHIDCFSKPDDREEAIKALKEGRIQVLSSVDLLTKGFDYPGASCAILARPTKSLMVYVQQVGRVLRISDGKDSALVLDHAGNTARHGFVTDDMPTELDDGKKKEAKPKDVQKEERLPKPCPSCSFMKVSHKCPACGFAPKTQPKGIEHEEGELSLLKGKEQKGKTKSKYTTAQKEAIYAQLLGYAKLKGYKDGWAYFQAKAMCGTFPAKKVTPMETGPEVMNFIKYSNIRRAKSKQRQESMFGS